MFQLLCQVPGYVWAFLRLEGVRQSNQLCWWSGHWGCVHSQYDVHMHFATLLRQCQGPKWWGLRAMHTGQEARNIVQRKGPFPQISWENARGDDPVQGRRTPRARTPTPLRAENPPPPPPARTRPPPPSAPLWQGAKVKQGSRLERGFWLVAFSNCVRFGRGNTTSRDPIASDNIL